MNLLQCSSGSAVHDLAAVILENDLLRIVVLPEAGSRIWQITYKPLASDLLWNNPALSPARQPRHASYDDTWSGGWDELFPNDEAGRLGAIDLPDHGELWTSEWQAQLFHQEDTAGVRLRTETPLSRFVAEKTLVLSPDSAILKIEYRLTNQGPEPFPFLWKLHPAFNVSPQHRIDFPRMTVVREPEFEGTLAGTPAVFSWPCVSVGDEMLDLRHVPDVSSHALHFFYGTELAAGWCGVTNQEKRLAAALRFDPEVFASCWLFATYGGWRDLNVAVLEPATGYPFRMQSMIDEGRARWLAPGESLSTAVLFSVQEGMTSIGGVEADGRILTAGE